MALTNRSSAWSARGVLKVMVRRDLRIRYARSILGYLWTLLDPLSMAMVYYVVFAIIFNRRDAGYSPYFLFLIIGLLPWQWFNAAVQESTRSLLTEQKMVRTANIPRQLWVYRTIFAKGIEFLLSLPVIAGFVLFYMWNGETHPNWRLVLIPLAILMQFLLISGLGLCLAPINVLVSDSERVVRIILRAMFYATPIIYSIPAHISWIRNILLLNPMTGILEFYRAGFFDSKIDWTSVATSLVITCIFLVLGFYLFKRLEGKVLKEI